MYGETYDVLKAKAETVFQKLCDWMKLIASYLEILDIKTIRME